MKISIYNVIAGLSVVLVVGAVTFPMAAGRFLPQRKTDRLVELKGRLDSEMIRGHYASAEHDAIDINLLRPDRHFGDPYLAEIYYRQNRRRLAYEYYKRSFAGMNGKMLTSDGLKRFAELSEEAHQSKDATKAYRKLIDCCVNQTDVEQRAVDDISVGAVSPQDVKHVALAIDAIKFSKPGYISTIQNAVKLAPNQPGTHYAYAILLTRFGRRRSANHELEKAAKLMTPSIGKSWKKEMYSRLSFDQLDHDSIGIVGKDGKMTFKVKTVPLPESTKPLVEEANTQVGVSTTSP